MSSLESLVRFSIGSLDIIVSFESRAFFSLNSLATSTWSLSLYSHLRWNVDVVLYVSFRSLICFTDS